MRHTNRSSHDASCTLVALMVACAQGCTPQRANETEATQVNAIIVRTQPNPAADASRTPATAILIKDNIDVAGMATTAGSLALIDNIALADAPIVANLRRCGFVIVGKANLSEWANFRSTKSTSGWSAVGGLTRNPHDLARSACGSSSGSAAAVAEGTVDFAIGTETDGSITCPAAMCGVVGLKPTVGLLSGKGIVPISSRQDTAGPITKTVAQSAQLLDALTGTSAYSTSIDPSRLRGARLGILRFHCDGYAPSVDAAFTKACDQLRAGGAEVVEISTGPNLERISELEWTLLLHEFKDDINAYLASLPASVRTRSLESLIAFNEAHSADEMPHFGQEIFVLAQATDGRAWANYRAMADELARLTGPEGIDRLLRENNCTALIAPTTGRAYPIRLAGGDPYEGSCSTLPAASGYPHLTVPMGLAEGLPVGISFIGPSRSEVLLLSLASGFEQTRDGQAKAHKTREK